MVSGGFVKKLQTVGTKNIRGYEKRYPAENSTTIFTPFQKLADFSRGKTTFSPKRESNPLLKNEGPLSRSAPIKNPPISNETTAYPNLNKKH